MRLSVMTVPSLISTLGSFIPLWTTRSGKTEVDASVPTSLKANPVVSLSQLPLGQSVRFIDFFGCPEV
jgi:hypothetical protein